MALLRSSEVVMSGAAAAGVAGAGAVVVVSEFLLLVLRRLVEILPFESFLTESLHMSTTTCVHLSKSHISVVRYTNSTALLVMYLCVCVAAGEEGGLLSWISVSAKHQEATF